jgi:uncharacterized membrane protein
MAPLDQLPVERGFRMRGAGLSRIDIFSDIVFAIALVLLAVSLTVPKTARFVMPPLLSMVTVAVCLAMVLGGWTSHYTFFRRYGLRDRLTLILNCALLFLILFCVYPLKLLFDTISAVLFREGSTTWLSITVQTNGRLALYAMGFAVVFLLVAALYWNAWRRRDDLEFNAVERLLTVSSIIDALGLSAVGLLAALAALVLPASWSVFSAILYLLIVPWKTLNGLYFGHKARTLRKLVSSPTL